MGQAAGLSNWVNVTAGAGASAIGRPCLPIAEIKLKG